MAGPHPQLPIVVLGTGACEDTAIVRDRLRASGIPHEYVDIDHDPAGRSRVERLNRGHVVTPTVVVGEETATLAEPSLEDLATLIANAGHAYAPPAATHLHGTIASRPIPSSSLATAEGGSFSIADLRGIRQVALFLAHGADCRVCLGYARQLARRATDAEAAEARIVVAVSGSPGGAARWRHDVGDGALLVDDGDGAWKAAVTLHVGTAGDGVALLVLDRFLAPRAASSAADAGGLIDPRGAVAWLEFVDLECPECTHAVDWPEEPVAG
jgi:hypothetical protein